MLLAATGIGIGHAILPDHWMPLAVLARTRRYPLRRVARLALAAAVTHVVVSVLFGVALAAVGLRFREAVARHTGVVVGGVLVATGVVLVVMEVLGVGLRHSHADHEHDHDHDHECECERDLDREHDHDHGPACDGAKPTATAKAHLPAQAARGLSSSIAVLEHRTASAESESLTLPGAASDCAREPQRHRIRLMLPGVAAGRVPGPQRRRAWPMLPGAAARSEPEVHRRRNLLTALAPFGAAASPDLTILPLFLAAGAVGAGPALGVLIAFALATVAVMVGLTLAAAKGASLLTAPWIERRANALTAVTLLVIGVLVVTGVL
ncbi:hypothetical protein KGQ20_10305 [Catenulispora sp. NF23]|uniref:hypothetical protein n=1 Tax=Catenulispora pinistramenti TaxID=2705254 RepID=UPI001BA63407|nr:hypothetical protein [Catenulispora pinistramenti]MBS2533166.1 hypothetical protein [Catenulispora pinistramenti]